MDVINKELERLDKDLRELEKQDFNDVVVLCHIIGNLKQQNVLLRQKDKIVKSRTSQP